MLSSMRERGNRDGENRRCYIYMDILIPEFRGLYNRFPPSVQHILGLPHPHSIWIIDRNSPQDTNSWELLHLQPIPAPTWKYRIYLYIYIKRRNDIRQLQVRRR